MEVRGKKVMVVGMALSGISSARLLVEKGALPLLYDANNKIDLFDEFAGKAVFALGACASETAANADMLVLSPGVPTDLEFIKKAKTDNKPVIAEIELGFLFSAAKMVAVTGTNGKTTTTALTGEIFKNAGYTTYVLGNIGVPITEHAAKTKDGDIIVAETAALQLETIDKFAPRACAVLNITEDHLNRFGTMQNYIAAKQRIFENQTEDDFCVLNFDNLIVRSMEAKVRSKIIWFSRKVSLERGVFIEHGQILSSESDGVHKICEAGQVRIQGAHNLENALAAVALARSFGIAENAICETLKNFAGVEHRIEFVREHNGICYINDSKGTNPDSTEKAAAAMERPTVLILGGFDKRNNFESMFKGFGQNIRHVVALGQTKQKILQDAKAAGFKSICAADSFEDAVLKAKGIAQQGWNVLLSPACASYDMFENFEHRGAVFKAIVNSF